MMITWILVAQGSAAKLFEVRKNGQEIIVVKEFSHPQTAQKAVDVYSDRPGRSFESVGPLRHAMTLPTPVDEHERDVFAREMAEFLDMALMKHRFTDLILVSSKELLGQVRQVLSDGVSKTISHQLNKDLLSQGFSDKELVEKIRNDLDLLHL